MARKIPDNISLDDAEDEILFTQAALKADPDAAAFAATIDTWMDLVDEVRVQARDVRAKIADTDAQRIVANARLDDACERFGDELYLAVRKDRASPRWTQFFQLPVSRFVRSALRRQVNQVRGWLSSTDALLTQHKPGLETWANRADEALVKTSELALVRGQLAIAREQFAEALTHERDGLHAALAEYARENGLGRTWANTFFRTSASSSSSASVPSPSAPAPAEPSPAETEEGT